MDGRRNYRDEGSVMAIHSGLVVTCCGHRIDISRDELRKVAVVQVWLIDGHTATGLELSAVKVAADLLAERAQRFLGQDWTVARWVPQAVALAAGA